MIVTVGLSLSEGTTGRAERKAERWGDLHMKVL
jgi:hypothetical protein